MDRLHNVPGTPRLAPDAGRVALERRLMDQEPYNMDQARRDTVLAAIVERCSERGWTLIAAHVRTNHVHLIVDTDATAARVMNDLKSYASRVLNQHGFDSPERKRWARHGSTRCLRERENVASAIEYVTGKQGDSMAVFTGPTSSEGLSPAGPHKTSRTVRTPRSPHRNAFHKLSA